MTGDGTHASTQTETAAPPIAARLVFGKRLDLAEAYARRLAGDGVVRGLIGPREVDRLWERHLLNCAVVADLLPSGVRVVDVGSGAGLPGLALAIRRPDLRVDLVEPMQRRVDFLVEAVAGLGLADSVRVVRGRADEVGVRTAVGEAEWVVARAVAPLDRLVKWCLPLLVGGGTVLAVKGAGAAEEVAEHRSAVRKLGGRDVRVLEVGAGVLELPTRVVSICRSSGSAATAKGGA